MNHTDTIHKEQPMIEITWQFFDVHNELISTATSQFAGIPDEPLTFEPRGIPLGTVKMGFVIGKPAPAAIQEQELDPVEPVEPTVHLADRPPKKTAKPPG